VTPRAGSVHASLRRAYAAPDGGFAVARLLVVDDSAAVRDLCARMLAARGHTAVGAADGAEAVALYQEQRPDAVLLDLHMPGMHGLATLEAIRGVDPDARVAMLTSNKEAEMVQRALGLGARDYVVKPFRADRLDEAIDRLLSG
jgi:two-component system chemotaxis response regulator CheY